MSPAPSKPFAHGSLSTHVLFQALTHLQPLHKYPLALFSPKTWAQPLSLSPTVPAFSPTLLYPLRSNHSPRPFQPAQTGSKEDKSKAHFHRSWLQSPLASITTDPSIASPGPPGILAVWRWHHIGIHKVPRLWVNPGAAQCLRLAVLSLLALSHWERGPWTRDTTKGL